jgi:hemoglobin/transferrin/lactoferrin receptor protein
MMMVMMSVEQQMNDRREARCQVRMLVLAVWAAAGVAFAQSPDPSLAPVVVTGARSERAPDEVPATIDVLTGEALDPAQVQDIRDVARELPNVSVRRAAQRFSNAVSPGGTGREGNAGFNIRGLEGNRVLILVDGVRVPRELVSGVFGSAAFGRDYVDLGLVNRIEIQRGSVSALYGSDGLAGLVALETVRPTDLLRADARLGGRTVVGVDQEDQSRRLGLSLAGKADGGWSWLAAVQAARARELDNQGSIDAADSTRTRPNPERMRQHAMLAKVIWEDAVQRHVWAIERFEQDASVEVLSGRSVALTSPASVSDLDGTTDKRRTRLSWDGRWRIGQPWADEWRAVLALQQAQTTESSTELRPLQPEALRVRERRVRYDEDLVQATLQGEKSTALGADWGARVVYGLETVRTTMDNEVTGRVPSHSERFPLKRFPRTVEDTFAVFAQTEFASEAVSIIPALRWDRVRLDAKRDPLYPREPASLNDHALSPKLGLIWRYAPDAQLYANVATGFRAPNPLQLNNFFENLSGAGFSYRAIANPDLKPEKSRTVELGWRVQMQPVRWEVAAFHGRYRDFIEDLVPVRGRGTPGDPIVYQAINQSRVTLRGLELRGTWNVTSATQLRVVYGMTRGTVDTTGRPLNSVNPPEWVLALDHRPRGDWSWGLSVRHVRAKRASDVDSTGLQAGPFLPPGFTTVDLRARWQIDRDWRLSAALRNVTNRKYWEWSNVRGLPRNLPSIDAYSAPGRALSVALTRDF